jgi:recombinational DNA repair ATPase RecF
MTLKELEYALDNYYHHVAYNAAVKHRNDLVEEYQDQFDTLSSIEYSDMPHATTVQDGVLNTICRIDETVEQLKRRIVKAQEKINEIMRVDEIIEDSLPHLEHEEEEIVALRHGQSKEMKFLQIAAAMYYSEDRIKKKYRVALIKIVKLMEEE